MDSGPGKTKKDLFQMVLSKKIIDKDSPSET